MQNLFDINGKVALITGGARGMGRMIAEGLAEAGARVYITSRKADICEQTARELRDAGGDCVAIVADLGSAEAGIELAATIKERETRLDILVNNAGRTWGAPLPSFPDSAWDPVMTVNVQVPFTLVRELLPLLEASGGASKDDPARVINIGSLAGRQVERLNAFSYAASKAAIHHLSRELAAVVAERNVTVNAVIPGYFPTKMTAHIRADEDEMAQFVERIPLGRMGTPEDIAGICIFLASRAGAYITGAELVLDGGLSV